MEPPLLYVKYRDHTLFRNTDPNVLGPCVRVACGWVVRENDEAIWLCLDKPAERLPHEKLDPSTGLIILKSDILERKEIG